MMPPSDTDGVGRFSRQQQSIFSACIGILAGTILTVLGDYHLPIAVALVGILHVHGSYVADKPPNGGENESNPKQQS